jgi:hypothetical protein
LNFREYWLVIQADPEKRAGKGMTKWKKLCNRVVLPDSFPDRQVYDAYMKPSVKVSRVQLTSQDIRKEQLDWLTPDFLAIRDYLEDKLNWGKQKLDNMLGPLEKHLDKKGVRRQTTLDSFVLKTVSPPKNIRVASVVDKWKIKMIDPGSVKGGVAGIRTPKSRGARGKRRGGRGKK